MHTTTATHPATARDQLNQLASCAMRAIWSDAASVEDWRWAFRRENCDGLLAALFFASLVPDEVHSEGIDVARGARGVCDFLAAAARASAGTLDGQAVTA